MNPVIRGSQFVSQQQIVSAKTASPKTPAKPPAKTSQSPIQAQVPSKSGERPVTKTMVVVPDVQTDDKGNPKRPRYEQVIARYGKKAFRPVYVAHWGRRSIGIDGYEHLTGFGKHPDTWTERERRSPNLCGLYMVKRNPHTGEYTITAQAK